MIIDVARKCCLSECLGKLGKTGLKQIRCSYFSRNGEDQDTFLVDQDTCLEDQEFSSWNTISFEYYLNIGDRVCQKALKIALGLGTRRPNRIQHRCFSGDALPPN